MAATQTTTRCWLRPQRVGVSADERTSAVVASGSINSRRRPDVLSLACVCLYIHCSIHSASQTPRVFTATRPTTATDDDGVVLTRFDRLRLF